MTVGRAAGSPRRPAARWQGCVFADRHYRPAPDPDAAGTARASARRPLRDAPANPAAYREVAGFETDLAVEVEEVA